MDITFPQDALDLAEDIIAKRIEFDPVGLLTHLSERYASGETEPPFLYDHLVITAWLKGGGNLTEFVRKCRELVVASKGDDNAPIRNYTALLKQELVGDGKHKTEASKMVDSISLAIEAWLLARR